MFEWILESESHSDEEVKMFFVLNETRKYKIGRSKDYDIVSLSPLVSRNHGVICLKEDGKIYIKDLHSSNGTYINDKKIEPDKDSLLNKNDLLSIGGPSTADSEKKEIFRIRCRPRVQSPNHGANSPINLTDEDSCDAPYGTTAKISKDQNFSDVPFAEVQKEVHTYADNNCRTIQNTIKLPENDIEVKNSENNKSITSTEHNISKSNPESILTNVDIENTTRCFPDDNVVQNYKSNESTTYDELHKHKSHPKSKYENKNATNESSISKQTTISDDSIEKPYMIQTKETKSNVITEQIIHETKHTSTLTNEAKQTSVITIEAIPETKVSDVCEKPKNKSICNETIKETPCLELSSGHKSLKTNSEITPLITKIKTEKPDSIIKKHIYLGRMIICCSSDEETPEISNEKIVAEKNVQQTKNVYSTENNSSFTQNDVDDIVVVSDDDDDIFPMSQLFNETVKTEPEEREIFPPAENCISPIIFDNNDEINGDDIFSTVKKEVHDYDYNDNDDDVLDDDCISWYNKLSQSQDSIISTRKLKTPDEKESSSSGEKNKAISDDVDLETIFSDLQKLTDSRDDGTLNVVDIQKSGSNIELIEPVEFEGISDIDEQPISKDLPAIHDVTDGKEVGTSDSSYYKLVGSEKTEDKADKIESKKQYVKPPVIDAPFLKKGKRKAHDDRYKESKSSTSKRRKSVHEENPVASSSSYVTETLTSIANKSENKTKKRRKSIDLSKNEKTKILEDRKKKLKELASKSHDSKDKKDDAHKGHTKPKVKVSTGRGLFLAEEDSKHSALKKKSKELPDKEPEPKKKFKIPKISDHSGPSTPTASTVKAIQKINKLSFNDLNVSPKPDSNIKVHNPNESIKAKEMRENMKSPVKKSILKDPNMIKKTNKNRVRFKEEPEIKYIERLPGDIWRKVTGKDAPMPSINSNFAADEIISTVLEWRPAWLEEQKKLNTSPEVSKQKPSRMCTNFNSIGDYFNIVKPLMLLELWKSVFRDWCSINAPVRLACIEDIADKNNSSFVNCYCLVDSKDTDYPRWGDLILIEYYFEGTDSKIATNKKFGYVTQSVKRRMIPSDVVHYKFSETGPVPPFKVSFKLKIKRSQFKIIQEKLVRIRFVSRMSPPLRIFKSVSCLQNSPLCDLILKPTTQQYKITRATQMTSAIEDNLNNDQLMCVFEAYQICCRNEPGIYLIQGPPGTGKSFVIKNLIRQLLCDVTKNQDQQKPRILLCAPSNGAVDEITNTLLDLRSTLNKNERFKMIRVGPPSSITHPKVKSISVLELVNKHLQAKQNNNFKSNTIMGEEYNFLIQKENTLKNKIMSLEARQLDSSSELINLRKVSAQIEQLKTNNSLQKDRRKEERDAEAFMIEKADIICTTLSSCIGSNSRLEELVAEGKIEFSCCIIDEATQSIEQETLLPLILGIKRFVLVGDPEQLSPTTLSHEAKELGHGNSLFSRIKSCFDHLSDNPIRMLTEQYRMNPEICKFPNNNFYGGKLKTAATITERTENKLEPYILFSLNNERDYKESEYLNTVEANLVLLLTDIIIKRTEYNVGIITPYSKQKEYLMSKYKSMRFQNKENVEDGDGLTSRVSINTVDGFQGQERDVIIISSVRYKSNIFLNDLQRLNVALTRAKHALFICAHSSLFRTQSIWQKLESDVKSRNCFYPLGDRDTTDERYISELILKK